MTFQKTIDPSLRLIVEEWKRTNLKREKQSDLNPEIFSAFSMLSEHQTGGTKSLAEVYETCVSLGRYDASLAWIVGVSNSAWSMLGNMSAQSVEQINYPIISMVLGRPGKVSFNNERNTATIDGEWKYCSGYDQSGGFIGLVKDESPEGKVYVAIMPSEKLKVTVHWNAIGLKGTGSHTVKADSLIVDRDTLVPYSAILAGTLTDESVISYRNLFTGVLMNCLTGSIVGATIHLLDLAIEHVSTHPIGGSSYAHGKDSGAIRTAIGHLASKLYGVYEFGVGGAKFVDQVAIGDNEAWNPKNRALLRARAARVMKQCREVADELLWLMGSSVMVEGSAVVETWKDIHVGTLHGGFSKFIPEEAAGLAFLGENPFEITKML